MVMRAEKFKDGGKVPGTILLREPQNGSPRVFSQLGSENNGGPQATKEERPSMNGFQVVGIGEDGVKRDKVKPLSTLDSNKAFKRSCSPHVKHSSLKVVLAATKGQNLQNVQEKANMTWMKENKENIEDAPSKNPSLPKKVKQMRSGCGNHSDGSNEDSSKLSKRRRTAIRDSVCQNGADTKKCQDESKILLFPQSTNEKSTSSDTTNMRNFHNPCHSMTWTNSAQSFSSTAQTASILTSFDDNQRSSDFMLNEVSALPLFKSSDSLKYLEEVSPKGNANGLSILGTAVFLSLGLDEIPCKSVIKLDHSHAQIDSSKNDSKGHAPYIGTDKCCPSTYYSTSCGIVKQSSPNLGADLTLGLPTELVEELPGDCNNANVNNEDVFPMDGFPEFEKIPHHKEVDIKHSVTETVLETNEMPSMNKLLQKQDETDDILAVSQVLEPDNIVTYLEKNEEIGKQDLAQSQLESESSICCLNTDLLIPDDRLDHKNAGKREIINQMGTGKHYMHFSDLSMPLRGTLLLPRGQKRARRFPIQVKRFKHEPLKQKKEGDKKEQVSKFSRVSAPSGLLADLNPGIISHVRNSKQVHAILEAVVGSDALTAYQDSRENFRPARKTKAEEKIPGTNYTIADAFENGDSEIMDMHHAGSDALEATDEHQSSEAANRKLEERLISDSCVSDHLFDIEERPTDTNLNEEGFEYLAAREDSIPPGECNRDWYSKQTAGERCNLQGTFSCHCHYCRPNDSSSMDLTCSASLSVKAATVASQWLELHYQDIKGRLAALKRSRKRVRAMINEEFGYTSLDHISATRNISKLFVQASSGDQHANMLADAEHDHMEKWMSLFSHMDNCLNVEGAKLEASLLRIKEMQAHCKWGLEELQGITPDCPQQQRPESLGDEFRSKVASAKIIERRFAVEAAAASIYSTANFVTTEDVSCF